MAFHTCGKYSRHGVALGEGEVCSYCAAIATRPEERCGTMKIIIESEQLQMDVLETLSTTSSLVKTEAEYLKFLEVAQ